MYPPLVWGYVGLLFFMIGDGVEAGVSLAVPGRRGGCPSESVGAGLHRLRHHRGGLGLAVGALSDLLGPAAGHGRRPGHLGRVRGGVPAVRRGAGRRADELPVVCTRCAGSAIRSSLTASWCGSRSATPRRPPGDGGRLVLVRASPAGCRPRLAVRRDRPSPRSGRTQTLWCSLAPGDRRRPHRPGRRPRADRDAAARPRRARTRSRTLLSSVSIAWEKPKTAIGCVVRVINTAPQNGFLVFLPIYFTETIGFNLGQWLRAAQPHVPEQHRLEPAVRGHRRPVRLAADGRPVRRRRVGGHRRCCSITSPPPTGRTTR